MIGRGGCGGEDRTQHAASLRDRRPPRLWYHHPMRITDLPPTFVRTVTTTFPRGAAWLADLPALADTIAARWDLTLGDHFNLSFNYVTRATRHDGTPVVLKIGYPSDDLHNELTALRIFAGRGAARLYDADPARGALLLEHVQPGYMLLTRDDDDAETQIAARCFRAVRQPAPVDHGLPTTHSWHHALTPLRSTYGGTTGPFPARLVDAAERLFAELHASEPAAYVLHGDLHHENIIDGGAAGWVVIDPHGVVGDPLAEVGAFFHNPYDRITAALGDGTLAQLTERRLMILAEELGADAQRIAAWGVGYAVLSAWWCVDQANPQPMLDEFAAASLACGAALLDLVR